MNDKVAIVLTKKFKNLNQLFSHINKNIKEIMETDIVEAVKDEQQRQIETEVYGKYEPFEYERRRWNGGLQDRDNMVATPIKKTKDGYIISVVNLTKGDGNESLYLAPLIEYGHGKGYGEYDYPYNRDNTAWKFLRARPFTQATVDALKKSGLLTEVMKQELNRRGIETI